MATTIYGSEVTKWRAWMTYETSSTDSTYTIKVTGAGFASINWGFDINFIDTIVACTGQTSLSATNQSFYSATGATVETSYVSGSFVINKTTSSQTITLSATVTNSSGYNNGTSTATTTITVPALTSYTIKYDANGGSGAPSSQTKYYGKTLTLSTTKPTYTGHTFLNWNTKSGGTGTSYASGASYTANAAATLYAQWEVNGPAITNIECYRADSSGTANEEGTYVYVKVTATSETTALSSASATCNNVTKTLTVSKLTASGTISANASTSNSYTVSVTVKDSYGSDTQTATIGPSFYIMDFHPSGGIGIARAASSNYLDIGTRVRVYDNYVSQRDSTLDRDAFPTDSTLNSACRWMIQDKDGDVASQIRVYQTTSETNRVSMRVYTDVDGTETSAGIAVEIASDGTRYVRPDTSSTYLSNYNQTNALFPTTSTTLRTATPYRVYGCNRLYYNSSGTTGTITLSETCANYAFVDVYFKDTSTRYYQQRVWSPNGKSTNIVRTVINATTLNAYISSTIITFSGTSLTQGDTCSYELYGGADYDRYIGGLSICGVWGWKG